MTITWSKYYLLLGYELTEGFTLHVTSSVGSLSLQDRNMAALRENYHLPAAGWSNWKKAMVPSQPNADPANLKARNGSGSMWRNIRGAFPDHARHCGIYEWQARKAGQPNRVVYVGSTCWNKPGALRGRILQYCTNGSHKHVLIDDALDGEYELWVRVRRVNVNKGCHTKAEDEENELLAMYNYAWNIRNNGAIRMILP